MEQIVQIENVSTGQVSVVPARVWNESKNSPMFRGVFRIIQTIKEPPEVLALKAKKAVQKPGN